MTLKVVNEFRIIRQFFQSQQPSNNEIIQGIGDDCAVLNLRSKQTMAISVDTSIAGRHFPPEAEPYDIAARALNVALSDLAAMGANPAYFTLAMSIPQVSDGWLSNFSKGLFDAASQSGVILIGGDTTRISDLDSMMFSVTVYGTLAYETGLYRHGAQIDDYIYVSGCLGDAAFGLACYFNDLPVSADDSDYFINAYLRPQPAIQLGLALINNAHSCIDISDGLLQDLEHILTASSVGAELDMSKIPLSTALKRYCDDDKALSLALTGGDDYHLCFTSALAPDRIGIDNVFCIGRVKQTAGVEWINDPAGVNLRIASKGFDHFNEKNI